MKIKSKVRQNAQDEKTNGREKEMLRDERWRKRRIAVELWKARNREYYLAQKRACAARPEYLALRRERYRLRKMTARLCAEQADLSANKKLFDEFETGDKKFCGSSDPRGTGAPSTEGRDRTGAGVGTESQAAVQQLRSTD